MADPSPTQVLLERAKKGDRKALNDLYKLHELNLLAMVRKRLGPELRIRLESLDIVQDVYAAFCEPKNIEHFEYSTDEAFLKYVATMVANHIRDEIDYWRRQRRNPGNEVAQLSSSIAEAHAPTPSVIVQMQEVEALLQRALDRLPPDDREMIIARQEQGRSYEDIAAERGKTADAVRVKLKRLERSLLRVYQELESGDQSDGAAQR